MKILTKNSILIIGSLIVVFFAYKWYDIEQKSGNTSFEPFVTLAAAILTSLSFFLTSDSSSSNKSPDINTNELKKDVSNSSSKTIYQNHSGTGDNVAGNKIINQK